MLEVRDLSVRYAQHRALEDVTIRVVPGELAVILGANGAGKSSLLKAVAGICEGDVAGSVTMNGEAIVGLPPHRIVEAGIALVPEGRGVFADLSVRENLLLGAYPERARRQEEANLERVLALFPKLRERQRQSVRTMSGGEQQMVAIARAMMSSPTILMLDEPSLGLSPLLCKELFQSLADVREAGLGILLVEQNAKQSLAIADRGYLLENGRIMGEDSAERLAGDPNVQKAYLGVSGEAAPAVVHPPSGLAARDADDSAEAVASTAAGTAAFELGDARARALQRQATSDLIGGSVDDLVARAQALQADRMERQRSGSPGGNGRMHDRADGSMAEGSGDRLRDLLEEFETAAARARARTRRAVATPRPAPRDDDGDRSASPARAPAIEVWKRRPRIEVYRRAKDGSGELQRSEGEERD